MKKRVKKKIDKGFCFSYWGLSYRRKFIRILWTSPLGFLCLLFLPKDGFLIGSFHISRTECAIAFSILLTVQFIVQGVYTYLRWKREPLESEALSGRGGNEGEAAAVGEVRTKSWLQRHGLLCVSAFCTPIILGALIVLIALTFPPNWGKPALSSMDRFMVDLFCSGAWLIVAGKLLFPVGLFLGIILIRRDGIRSRQSQFSILVMALGLAAGIYGYLIFEILRTVLKDIPH